MNTSEKIRDGLETIIKRINEAIKTNDAQFLTGSLLHIRETAKGMLTLPRRNCDVGTAQEQEDRFCEFCVKHGNGEFCQQDCPCLHESESCKQIWDQLPYEETDQ